MISFNLVVSCNNLIAIRKFCVFLKNYELHEKPTFLHRMASKAARTWLEAKALYFFAEVRKELVGVKPEAVTLDLYPSDLFSVMVLGLKPDVYTASELFHALADTELACEKIKKPREEIKLGTAGEL